MKNSVLVVELPSDLIQQNNMRYFCFVFFLSYFIFISGAGAQTADNAFSISKCIEYASVNNSNLKVSRFGEQIALQQTSEVKGRALPQANINGVYEDKLKVPLLIIPGSLGGAPSGAANAASGTGSSTGSNKDVTAIRMGYQFNTSVVGEVTQMIFDPSFGIGLKAAKQSTVLYKQQTVQTTQQTVYSIATAYYKVIVLQKQLQFIRSNLNSTQKTLATTELQYKNGVAKQVDVSRLRVNSSNLQSQARQTELSAAQALNALKFQMGMPLTEAIVLTDTALTYDTGYAPDISKEGEIFNDRIEYKLLQTNLQLQQLDKSNTYRGYYPTLTGFANYGYQAQGPNFGVIKTPTNNWVDYTTSSIGLRLRIPVFDGLQRHARSQQSELKIRQLRENLNLSKQSIGLEVANAQTQYQNTLQRIESERTNVELAQEVYQVTQLEFREGVSNSVAVITAETSLRQAQNTYTQTLLELYTARLDLEKAKGTLLTYFATK